MIRCQRGGRVKGNTRDQRRKPKTAFFRTLSPHNWCGGGDVLETVDINTIDHSIVFHKFVI